MVHIKYIISFLLGLFITLSIFNNNFIKNENYVNNVPLIEKKEDIKEELELPKKESIYILITTFNEGKNIINNELKWYNENIDKSLIISTDDNTSSYITYNNIIELKTDNYNSTIKGAIIKNIELKGPLSLYFANENNKKYELTIFSILFMLKINDINDKCTLFEMIGNTSINDKDKNNIKYIANIISINLLNTNKESTIDIEILIGSQKYNIINIDKKILINTYEVIMIGLILNNNDIIFIINNIKYNFKYNENDKITLGSNPIIINKYGKIDMILYSFIYYKTALNYDELIKYRKYNNNYIIGINKYIEKNNEIYKKLKETQKEIIIKQNHINRISNQLNNYTNKKKMIKIDELNELDETKIFNITPLQIINPSDK